MEKIDEDVCGVGILSVILLGFIQSFVANANRLAPSYLLWWWWWWNAGTFCSYQNCL